MKNRLQKRLEELKSEFESGQKMMADLEAKHTEIQKNMLRISGAIQVLEEEIARCDEDSSAEVVDIKSGEGTG